MHFVWVAQELQRPIKKTGNITSNTIHYIPCIIIHFDIIYAYYFPYIIMLFDGICRHSIPCNIMPFDIIYDRSIGLYHYIIW